MPTYEINLWDNKKVIQKVVQEFANEEEVQQYIKEHFDTQPDPVYPGLDQNVDMYVQNPINILLRLLKYTRMYVRKDHHE